MKRGGWIAVVATLAVIAGVTALAFRSVHRDRAALVGAFADESLARLRLAIREIETELEAVRQHLDLATRLVDAADSGNDQRRELEALLAVVGAYRLMIVFDADGRERVVAMDPLAAGASRAPFSDVLRRTARAAVSRQALAISEPLGDPASPWYRAFATPLSRDGRVRGALVLLVDQKSTFERLRLVAAGSAAKLLLLGPHGTPAPLSDPGLTAALAAEGGGLGDVVRRMRAGHTGSATLPGAEARRLGIAGGEAVAAFAPIRTGDAGHWAVAIVDSTAALRSQEQAIVLRIGLLAGAVALALGALSAYLVVSARRAILVQERLRAAEELAHLSSQLLRAEKLATVGVLAAGIAHEVGTPLGVVRGRAELLVSKLGPAHPQTDSARIIVGEIDRVSRTIQELLDFARVSRAPGTVVPLDGVARDVAALLAFEARTRKVSLAVDVAPGLAPLAADADQLKQVLVNLALNGLHACGPGGHVTIRASPEVDGRRARIEVVDDGAGIPEELRHRVFDPFFTTKKRGKGTGLGLTVAAQIVRNHGGEIDLEGAAGQGTRAVVRWPLAAVEAEELDGQAERRAHSRGR